MKAIYAAKQPEKTTNAFSLNPILPFVFQADFRRNDLKNWRSRWSERNPSKD